MSGRRKLLSLCLFLGVIVSVWIWQVTSNTYALSKNIGHQSGLSSAHVAILQEEPIPSLDKEGIHRFETVDTWRPRQPLGKINSANAVRLQRPSHTFYTNKADFMRQPLVADYDEGEMEKIFLMIKTGGTVFWKRMPAHMFTTLTRFQNFALYSDAPGAIGGHEVIDILANLPEDTYDHENFVAWKRQKYLHDHHTNVYYDEIPSKTDEGIARNTGWHLDKYKNIPMLYHAWNLSPGHEWYVYIDGDTLLFVDSLIRILKSKNPDEHCYLGNLRSYRSNLHNELISFAQGGSGVVLSRKTMQEIGTHPEWIAKYTNITHNERGGDDMVAIMLKDELNVEVEHSRAFHEENLRNTNFRPESWCEPIISLHHVVPQDNEVFWEYETVKRLEGSPIYHSTLYRDFIMPYISDRVEYWDNHIIGEGIEYNDDKKNEVKPKSEGGPDLRPYESVDSCEQWCQQDEKCLNWHHRAGPNSRCVRSKLIKIGKAAQLWQTTSRENERHTSGWMVDRIRQMRASSGCDHPENGPKEGWALNLLK